MFTRTLDNIAKPKHKKGAQKILATRLLNEFYLRNLGGRHLLKVGILLEAYGNCKHSLECRQWSNQCRYD